MLRVQELNRLHLAPEALQKNSIAAESDERKPAAGADKKLGVCRGSLMLGIRYYFRFAPSSAMYIISCLKMNRLGAPSRVSRIMFLS
jgi:hypothetical protein